MQTLLLCHRDRRRLDSAQVPAASPCCRTARSVPACTTTTLSRARAPSARDEPFLGADTSPEVLERLRHIHGRGPGAFNDVLEPAIAAVRLELNDGNDTLRFLFAQPLLHHLLFVETRPILLLLLLPRLRLRLPCRELLGVILSHRFSNDVVEGGVRSRVWCIGRRQAMRQTRSGTKSSCFTPTTTSGTTSTPRVFAQ